MATKSIPTFEHRTCTRCGGCGQYSYNQMHGSVCYGCGGSGVQLTKRGAVAQAFYVESCKVRVDSIQVGDLVEYVGVTNGGGTFRKFVKVEEIEHSIQRGASLKDGVMVPYALPTITFWSTIGRERYGSGGWPDSLIRKGWDAESKKAKIAAALAYQESLTKSGTPMKRKLTKAA